MVDNMAEQPAAKLPRQATNFRLCLICQQETPEVLINSPSSHNKLLHDIRERATYGDKHYPEVNRRIGDTSEESLLSEGATWHRSCYMDTCNVTICRRAKPCYEKQLTQKVQSQSAPVPLNLLSHSPAHSQSHMTLLYVFSVIQNLQNATHCLWFTLMLLAGIFVQQLNKVMMTTTV
jgi:hypothetical protein